MLGKQFQNRSKLSEEISFPAVDDGAGSREDDGAHIVAEYWLLRHSYLDEFGWEIVERWDAKGKRPVGSELDQKVQEKVIPGDYFYCSVSKAGTLIARLQTWSIGNPAIERMYRRHCKEKCEEKDNQMSDSESDVWEQLETMAGGYTSLPDSVVWEDLEQALKN